MFRPRLLGIVYLVVGVAVAYNVIGWLLRLATPTAEAAEMPDWGRRRFIGTSVGVAALAVAGGGLGRLLLNGRADAAPTAGIPTVGTPTAGTPIAGIPTVGIVTAGIVT